MTPVPDTEAARADTLGHMRSAKAGPQLVGSVVVAGRYSCRVIMEFLLGTKDNVILGRATIMQKERLKTLLSGARGPHTVVAALVFTSGPGPGTPKHTPSRKPCPWGLTEGPVVEQSSLVVFNSVFLLSQTLSGGALRNASASTPGEGPGRRRKALKPGRGPHGAVHSSADPTAAAQHPLTSEGPRTEARPAQETPPTPAAWLDRATLLAWLHGGHHGDWRGRAPRQDGGVGAGPAPGCGWPDRAAANPQRRGLRRSSR